MTPGQKEFWVPVFEAMKNLRARKRTNSKLHPHVKSARSKNWTYATKQSNGTAMEGKCLITENFNVYENMKVIYVYCSLRNEYESDPCSNKQYLSNSENKAWKKKNSCKDQILCTTEVTQQVGLKQPMKSLLELLASSPNSFKCCLVCIRKPIIFI